MRFLFVAAVLIISPAFAQQQQGPQSACEKNLFEISGISNVMLARAQDEAVGLQKQLAAAQAEVKRLTDKYEPKETLK